MNVNEVADAIIGDGYGALFRSSIMTLMLIPRDSFNEAVLRINHITSLGPMVDPTAFLDGTKFENARQWSKVLEAAGKLRAALEAMGSTEEASRG